MSNDELMTSGRWAPLLSQHLRESLSAYPYLFDAIVIGMSFLIGLLVAWVARRAFVRIVTRFYARHATLDAEVRNEIVVLASRILWIVPVGVVCYWSDVTGMHKWLEFILLRTCLAVISILTADALCHGINLLGSWYRSKLGAKNRPIDGLIATVRMFIFAAGAVCAVSLLLGKSPVILLSAIGAVAAVLMIVFQDSLLSLAASVQVYSSQLVNIGDWIVKEDKGVDGFVEAMTLHTVKVRNWDETVVALPVVTLVQEPFVNMSRMQETGGRRYMRDFLIDFRSVRFLRQEELEELRRFDRLLGGEDASSGRHVADVKPNGPVVSDKCHQTNLGAFRAYLMKYLRRHPLICQDKLMLVATRETTSQGVPLEVYAFTTQTDYSGYSAVASDITEHVLAVLPSFHLRVFQECSDIYQSVGDRVETVDGTFTYETYANPDQ